MAKVLVLEKLKRKLKGISVESIPESEFVNYLHRRVLHSKKGILSLELQVYNVIVMAIPDQSTVVVIIVIAFGVT